MALKKLLTNLEQGLQAYPNHNTPSSVGGFNHDKSTSIFDSSINFNQKSYTFGQGTAFDRPFGDFSSEPFVKNSITEALNLNPTIENIGQFGDMNSGVPNSLIRGGAKTHLFRQVDDLNRITRFLITPQGLAFTTKQVGLQLSNPRIDKPSNSQKPYGDDGLVNFIGTLASNIAGSVANQRTYNLGGNLLAQILAQGTGLHIKREGLLPTATKGYINADGTGTLDGPNLFADDSNNRLIYLLEDKIYTNTGVEPEPENKTGFNKFVDGAKEVYDKASEFLFGKSQHLGPLYDYSGGPESVYGIGKTTIRRYTTSNKNDLSRLGDSDRYYGYLSNDFSGISNFLQHLSDGTADGRKPHFDYNANAKGGRKFYRENRIGLGNPGVGVGKDNDRQDAHILRKRKNGTLNYNIYDATRTDIINMLDVFKTEGNFAFPEARDLIRFRFEAVDTDNPVASDVMIFRAYLDTFTDNFNATHNEFNYNGRGETFYTYNNFKRSINLSFKIAAQTRHEMMPLYRKLNYLVSNTAPEYGRTGRIRTPFMKLTVGSYLDRVPGILNSVGVTWQKDYPWEIAIDGPEDEQDKNMLVLPHVLDVSVAFTPVHNFLPQKSIHAPFILSHTDNRFLSEGKKWYKPEIATSVAEALQPGVEKLGGTTETGLERTEDFSDEPTRRDISATTYEE